MKNFWRTYDQQEIDLIEHRSTGLKAIECNWSETKKVHIPGAFAKTYPDAQFSVISLKTISDWLIPT